MVSSEDLEIIEQLKKDFIDESIFYLEQWEEACLNLENEETRAEEIAKIFRIAHSMKGSGAAPGYMDLSGFAHVLEDTLSILRDNPNLIEDSIISILLKTTDLLKKKIEYIKNDQQEPWNVEDMKKELKQLAKKLQGIDTQALLKDFEQVLDSTPKASLNVSTIEIPDYTKLRKEDIDFKDPRWAPNPTLDDERKAKEPTSETVIEPTRHQETKADDLNNALNAGRVSQTSLQSDTLNAIESLLNEIGNPPPKEAFISLDSLISESQSSFENSLTSIRSEHFGQPALPSNDGPIKAPDPIINISQQPNLKSENVTHIEHPKTTSPVKTEPHKESKNNNQITTVKIDTDRIDTILNIVGELVVIKSQLMNQTSEYATDLKLHAVVNLMDKTIRDLQDQTLTMRMMPLKNMFLKLQRTIRDLSIKLSKPVELKMFGEDTELDRNMVELLGDPLLHICRNSLDHGIESKDKRSTAGKNEKGMISLSARQMGGRVVIEVKDDGAGINTERVFQKAKSQGMIPDSVKFTDLSEKEIISFIFKPGFSTAEQITDVSGRGVGMDVVKSNIEKLRGNIDIETKLGSGTTLSISLPLTTSITDGMVVEVGGQPFIIPMNTIHELVNTHLDALIQLHMGQVVLRHRDKFLPIIDMKDYLIDKKRQPMTNFKHQEDQVIIVVEVGNKQLALKLDKIHGQVQVVLKPLTGGFDTSKGIAGATILGNGKVALVIDPVGLSQYVQSLHTRSTHQFISEI